MNRAFETSVFLFLLLLCSAASAGYVDTYYGPYSSYSTAQSACYQILNSACNSSGYVAAAGGDKTLYKQNPGSWYPDGNARRWFFGYWNSGTCAEGTPNPDTGLCEIIECPTQGDMTWLSRQIGTEGVPGNLTITVSPGAQYRDTTGCGLNADLADGSVGTCYLSGENMDEIWCNTRMVYTGEPAPEGSSGVYSIDEHPNRILESRIKEHQEAASQPSVYEDPVTGEIVTTQSTTIQDTVSEGATVTKNGGTFSVYKWGQNTTTKQTDTEQREAVDGSSTTTTTTTITETTAPYSVVNVYGTGSAGVTNKEGSEKSTTETTTASTDANGNTSTTTTTEGDGVTDEEGTGHDFAGPDVKEGVKDFDEIGTGYWEQLQAVPIIAAVQDISGPSGTGTCPASGSFVIFGESFSFDFMCTLMDDIRPVIEVAAKAAWTLLAVFILLGA